MEVNGKRRFAKLVGDGEHASITAPTNGSVSSIQHTLASSSPKGATISSHGQKSSASDVMEEGDLGHMHKQPRDACVKSSDTAEFAFFLRNTGPTAHNSASEKRLARASSRMKRKSGLNLFSKRKTARNSVQSTHQDPRPYDIVERTLSNGKTYFQIKPSIAADQLPPIQTQEGPSDLTQVPPRISDCFSSRTATANTDALDLWLVNAALGRHIEESAKQDATSRSLDINHANKGPIAGDDKLVSLKAFAKPETSWAMKLLNHKFEPQQPNKDSELSGQHAPGPEKLDLSNSSNDKPEQPVSFGSIVDAAVGSARRSSSRSISPRTRGGENVSKQDNEPWQPTVVPPKEDDAQSVEVASVDEAASAGTNTPSSLRHSRHIITRAKKLRDLRQARRQQEEPRSSEEDSEYVEKVGRLTGSTVTCDQEDSGANSPAESFHSTQAQSEQPTPKPSSDTHMDNLSTSKECSMSSIMLVADQSPIFHAKQTKRPDRLLLSTMQATRDLAVVVHENLAQSAESSPKTSTSQHELRVRSISSDEETPTKASIETPQQEDRTVELPQEAAKVITPSTEWDGKGSPPLRRVSTPLATSPLLGLDMESYGSINARTLPPPPPEDRRPQSVRSASTTTPSRSPWSSFAQTIPAQLRPTSISSSVTSGSKELRLEARVELLERENKLLEAALTAVLKTGGKLNGCPCGRRNDRTKARISKSSENMSFGRDGLSGSAERHRDLQQDFTEARRSPLSVYLETRLHNVSHAPAVRRPQSSGVVGS